MQHQATSQQNSSALMASFDVEQEDAAGIKNLADFREKLLALGYQTEDDGLPDYFVVLGEEEDWVIEADEERIFVSTHSVQYVQRPRIDGREVQRIAEWLDDMGALKVTAHA